MARDLSRRALATSLRLACSTSAGRGGLRPSLRRLAGHQLHDVRAPEIQRTASFLKVDGLIVSAGDAALVSTDMTENFLHHMRRDAKAIVQGGRHAAAEIVQPPFQRLAMARRNARIQIDFAPRPVLVAASDDSAKNMLPRRTIRVGALRKCFQDAERRLRQRDHMLASLLGSR